MDGKVATLCFFTEPDEIARGVMDGKMFVISLHIIVLSNPETRVTTQRLPHHSTMHIYIHVNTCIHTYTCMCISCTTHNIHTHTKHTRAHTDTSDSTWSTVLECIPTGQLWQVLLGATR